MWTSLRRAGSEHLLTRSTNPLQREKRNSKEIPQLLPPYCSSDQEIMTMSTRRQPNACLFAIDQKQRPAWKDTMLGALTRQGKPLFSHPRCLSSPRFAPVFLLPSSPMSVCYQGAPGPREKARITVHYGGEDASYTDVTADDIPCKYQGMGDASSRRRCKQVADDATSKGIYQLDRGSSYRYGRRTAPEKRTMRLAKLLRGYFPFFCFVREHTYFLGLGVAQGAWTLGSVVKLAFPDGCVVYVVLLYAPKMEAFEGRSNGR